MKSNRPASESRPYSADSRRSGLGETSIEEGTIYRAPTLSDGARSNGPKVPTLHKARVRDGRDRRGNLHKPCDEPWMEKGLKSKKAGFGPSVSLGAGPTKANDGSRSE